MYGFTSDKNVQTIGPLLQLERKKTGISQASISHTTGLTQATAGSSF
jgi:hypothetical protein